MTADSAAAVPPGTHRGDYVWDGANWVPHTDSTGCTFDGTTWRLPPESLGGFSPPPVPAAGFADPRYSYGLTRRTSDDLQFIARYVKVILIVGLVLAAVYIVVFGLALGGLFTLIGTLSR